MISYSYTKHNQRAECLSLNITLVGEPSFLEGKGMCAHMCTCGGVSNMYTFPYMEREHEGMSLNWNDCYECLASWLGLC